MDTFTTTHGPSWGRRLSGFGLALVLALGFVACGDDDDDNASDGGGGTTESSADNGSTAGGTGGEAVGYEVSSLSYSDLSAPAGGTIEINNTSGAPHTFTADDGSFEADVSADGTSTVQVPDQPGEYPFHCEIHSSMHATLTVTG